MANVNNQGLPDPNDRENSISNGDFESLGLNSSQWDDDSTDFTEEDRSDINGLRGDRESADPTSSTGSSNRGGSGGNSGKITEETELSEIETNMKSDLESLVSNAKDEAEKEFDAESELDDDFISPFDDIGKPKNRGVSDESGGGAEEEKPPGQSAGIDDVKSPFDLDSGDKDDSDEKSPHRDGNTGKLPLPGAVPERDEERPGLNGLSGLPEGGRVKDKEEDKKPDRDRDKDDGESTNGEDSRSAGDKEEKPEGEKGKESDPDAEKDKPKGDGNEAQTPKDDGARDPVSDDMGGGTDDSRRRNQADNDDDDDGDDDDEDDRTPPRKSPISSATKGGGTAKAAGTILGGAGGVVLAMILLLVVGITGMVNGSGGGSGGGGGYSPPMMDDYASECSTEGAEDQTDSSVGTAGVPNGEFSKPEVMPPGMMTSPFGNRGGAPHKGMDISTGGGGTVKIYAYADGVVTNSGPATGFGQWITIEHKIDGKTYTTVYGHMYPDGLHVKTGDKVKAGQYIADQGSNGQSSGPHVHFEIYAGKWGENVQDPAPYVEKAVNPGTGDISKDRKSEKPDGKESGDTHTVSEDGSKSDDKVQDVEGKAVDENIGTPPVSGHREPFGIDVSSNQNANSKGGGWDISRIITGNKDLKFLYVKSTEGTTYTNPYFKDDVKQINQKKIPVGYYHYAVMLSKDSAVKEAEYFVKESALDSAKTMTPALDIEEMDGQGRKVGSNLSVPEKVQWIKDFAGKVKDLTGRETMLYVSPGWWQANTNNSPDFKDYPLWVANWMDGEPVLPGGFDKWVIHQYGATNLNGYSDIVDADRFNGSEEDIQKMMKDSFGNSGTGTRTTCCDSDSASKEEESSSDGGSAPSGDEVNLDEAAQKNATTIIASGKALGIKKEGIITALMVASIESHYLNFANDGTGGGGESASPDVVKKSLKYPHDAVGHDTDSIGLFQQRVIYWTPFEESDGMETAMKTAFQSGQFYAVMKDKGYEGKDKAQIAHEIQGNATGTIYAEREGEANTLYDKYEKDAKPDSVKSLAKKGEEYRTYVLHGGNSKVWPKAGEGKEGDGGRTGAEKADDLSHASSSDETDVECASSESSTDGDTSNSGDDFVNDGSLGARAVEAALSQIGKPYIWGGTGPDGYDCSGLTSWAYAKAGSPISRTAASQRHDPKAKDVPLDEVKPGDLIFYYDNQNPSHVAMAISKTEIVHAPDVGQTVTRESLNYTTPVAAVRISGEK